MKIHVETDRLLLRDIEYSDIESIFALDSDPEVHRYLGNQPIKTLAQAEASIDYIRQQYEDNGIGRWAVIDKVTNEFMGWSGLKYETVLREEFNYYDLGYRLRREYWGRGVATESALASLRYGFTQMQLDEICAAADIENLASNHILQKVGLQWTERFTFEGTACHFYRLPKTLWKL